MEIVFQVVLSCLLVLVFIYFVFCFLAFLGGVYANQEMTQGHPLLFVMGDCLTLQGLNAKCLRNPESSKYFGHVRTQILSISG